MFGIPHSAVIPLVSFTWRDTRVLFPSSHPSPTTAPPSPPRPLTIANNRCAVERERSPSETETEQCVCRSFSQELVHAIRKFGDGDDDRKHHLRFLFPRPPSCTKLPWQTAVHQVLLQEKATGIRPLTFHFFFLPARRRCFYVPCCQCRLQLPTEGSGQPATTRQCAEKMDGST